MQQPFRATNQGTLSLFGQAHHHSVGFSTYDMYIIIYYCVCVCSMYVYAYTPPWSCHYSLQEGEVALLGALLPGEWSYPHAIVIPIIKFDYFVQSAYIYISLCVCAQYINGIIYPVYPSPQQRVLVQGTGGCWTWASSISDRSSSAATLSLCKWDAPFGTKKKQRKRSKTKAQNIQNDLKGSEMDMKNENHEGHWRPLHATTKAKCRLAVHLAVTKPSVSHRRPQVFESGLAVRTAIAAWRVQECRCRLRWPTRQSHGKRHGNEVENRWVGATLAWK